MISLFTAASACCSIKRVLSVVCHGGVATAEGRSASDIIVWFAGSPRCAGESMHITVQLAGSLDYSFDDVLYFYGLSPASSLVATQPPPPPRPGDSDILELTSDRPTYIDFAHIYRTGIGIETLDYSHHGIKKESPAEGQFPTVPFFPSHLLRPVEIADTCCR